eukprot:scaffold128188_cov23-Tisochrysis_lutea.AAC.2
MHCKGVTASHRRMWCGMHHHGRMVQHANAIAPSITVQPLQPPVQPSITSSHIILCLHHNCIKVHEVLQQQHT